MNKQAQRVALKYARSGVTMVEADEFSEWDSTHGYDIYVDGENAGFIEGQLHIIGLDEVRKFACSEDIEDLWERWGEDLTFEYGPEIPIFEITRSELNKSYLNQKLGLMMYKHIAYEVRQEVDYMFLVPNYCYDGKTSKKADRVWKSLTRSNSISSNSTTSGDVILMLDRRLR